MHIGRDALNVATQLVLNAGVLRLRRGQTDVTRQDANAHSFTNRQPCIAHPNATAFKVDTRQMPLLVHCADASFNQRASIFTHNHWIDDLGEDRSHRTLRFDLPLIQHHQMIGQASDFFC